MIKTQNKTANKKVKKSDPKVSVIIPVYNVEPYLRQGLDSVVNQTLKDIEIICVDDKSTDSSLEILKEYAKKDSRFVILEQETNQGQGVARNRALDIAKGEYIMFLDPDDWLELNACEDAYNQIAQNKNDMVLFSFNRYYQETGILFQDKYRQNTYSNLLLIPQINLQKFTDFRITDLFIWGQIYERNFINKHHIRFDTCRMFEDQLFMGQCYIHSRSISILDKYLYNYRIRNNSTTYTEPDAYKDFFRTSTVLFNIMLSDNCSESFTGIFLSHRIKSIFWWQDFFSKYGKQIEKDFYGRMRKLFIYIKRNINVSEYKSVIGKDNYKKFKKIVKYSYTLSVIRNKAKRILSKIFSTGKDELKNKYFTIFGKKIFLSSVIRYKYVGYLLGWIFPTKHDRHRFRNMCEDIDTRLKLSVLPGLFQKHIRRIRRKKGKIRVLFLVNENSKWKAQTLYDLMAKSDRFEAIIALTIADRQWEKSKTEKAEIINNNYNYFANNHMKCVFAYDLSENKPVSLKIFKPDIVFYQQPWYLDKKQSPLKVSEYALTCYIPYYVPNFGILKMDYQTFHKYLFRYYVTNKAWENFYKTKITTAKNIAGLGHTELDKYYLNKNIRNIKHYVIYAPHWSIHHPDNKNAENYSTFEWSGKFMLEYAKAHPEINWVFKPHPTLKNALQKIGIPKEEIESYYSEWEQVAKACYNADYINMFMQSDAMITDCGSFLVEYFYSGKPLIHLISEYNSTIPPKHMQPVFASFYDVNNTEELKSALDYIIIQHSDPKKEQRNNMLSSEDFKLQYAAKNIMEDLENVLDIKETEK